MAAGILDLTIEQGTTFALVVKLKDDDGNVIDLTGYTMRGQVRATCASATTIIAFTCTNTDPTLGQFTCTLTAAQTTALATTGATFDEYTTYVYDVEIVSGAGVVTRVLNGAVFISPEATK